MAYLTFDNNVDTLQLGFDPSAPEFLLRNDEFLPFGSQEWAIFEGRVSDGQFDPGEVVQFAPVNVLLEFDQNDVVEVTFLGVVDVDGDGFSDGVAISDRGSESILTDKKPFIDFSPFSTEVVVSRTSVLGLGTSPSNQPTNGDDVLSGTRENDVIRSLGGDDVVEGLAGKDKLFGGTGNDTLNGGNGNDNINGGKGKDVLIGGKGQDDFIFGNKYGVDRIKDFNANSNAENIDVSGVKAIKNFRDLKNNHMEQKGDDVIIDDGKGTKIVLLGTDVGDLGRGDFLF